MKRVPKPHKGPLAIAALTFIVATAECGLAATYPTNETGAAVFTYIVAAFMVWWCGRSWSFWWRWRGAYKKYEEWLKQ